MSMKSMDGVIANYMSIKDINEPTEVWREYDISREILTM